MYITFEISTFHAYDIIYFKQNLGFEPFPPNYDFDWDPFIIT